MSANAIRGQQSAQPPICADAFCIGRVSKRCAAPKRTSRGPLWRRFGTFDRNRRLDASHVPKLCSRCGDNAPGDRLHPPDSVHVRTEIGACMGPDLRIGDLENTRSNTEFEQVLCLVR